MRSPLHTRCCLASALLLVACSGIPAGTSPGPAAAACCTREAFSAGLEIAERYRNPAITERRFTHKTFWDAVRSSTNGDPRGEPGSDPRTHPNGGLQSNVIGHSVLGREIRSVTFGTGPTLVLLWSQMHGDESTATMALADIFRFLAEAGSSPLRERLSRELTVVFVPMLNPDGAELFQRQNALGIDVNRDARRLSTPEARALKALHDSFKPHFGFNLHDQNARTRAGRQGPASAIALLPPAFDEAQSYDDVRTRARLIAATLARAFEYEIAGRVAKYDDTFNPRAFGDLIQQWGTSTVLIESGALPDDPQKQRLRALNVAAILLALDAIATRGYESARADWYESLPFNVGGASDLLIAGGSVVLPGKPPMLADIAVNYDDAVARKDGRVRDVGDLADVVAIDTIDASGLFIHAASEAITTTPEGPMLRIGVPATLDLRRGADRESELVRRLGMP